MAAHAPSLKTERLLQTFLEMVGIDSPSGHEDAFRDWLRERLGQLGIASWVDVGGNLIADIPGNRCAHQSLLVVSGHMDVVPPCLGVRPVVEGDGEDRLVRSDNTTVLGADDKAALAAILEAIQISLEQDLPRPPLRLILTTREETYLQGAFELDPKAYENARFALVFDHTGEQGTLITQAPSYYEFTIECHGKAAHAGMNPEDGVNAIVLAARIINRLRVGRLDEWTTANVATIQGGKATNIVPDRALIRGELRGHDTARLQAELAHIERVVQEERDGFASGCNALFEAIERFRAYRVDPEVEGVRRVEGAMTRLGIPIRRTHTNGGSDNNVFALHGLPGVVLSAGYVDPHALTERIRVKDLNACAHLLSALLEDFAAAPF
jgi:tripeptide aminopeptidase